jgi:hypothetical protein
VPTNAQNLDAAISNITALLAQLTATPKPAYTIDGVSYSWESYFAMLTGQLAELRRQRQVEDGAWQLTGRGVT